LPFVISKLEAHEPYWFSRTDDVPDPIDRETFHRLGVRYAAVVPLASKGEDGVLAALVFSSNTRAQEWAPTTIERLHLVAGVMSQAFARRVSYLALQTALDEIRRLRDRLAAENVELRREVKVIRTSQPIVSESVAIQRVLAPDRPLRGRESIDAFPRRDRGSSTGGAGQASACAAGARHRAAREHAADQGRRPHHRGDESQPR